MRPRRDVLLRPSITHSSSSSSSSPPPWLRRRLDSDGHSSSSSKLKLPVVIAAAMAGQSRKWMILVATIWIQAFTGTNFDFSAYSSAMKAVLGISQVQLNYLAVASDMGKVLGWSSGLALRHLPLSLVLFISAFLGFVGYGFQWLVITQSISLPYFLVIHNSLLSSSVSNACLY
ncbi:hypothetical protein TIFTF001_009934 [Ficus carica]|uniref:Nodulin-like domain-containing protein n=1 Tax=Ficus carica TaxID=3494 RepID=A0AA88D305_FICCA|nr:hypothetical protein TIFTF001_009934 [Ficus carica]